MISDEAEEELSGAHQRSGTSTENSGMTLKSPPTSKRGASQLSKGLTPNHGGGRGVSQNI